MFLLILQMGRWDRLWVSGFLKGTPPRACLEALSPASSPLAPSSDLRGRDPAFPWITLTQVWVWTPSWSGAGQAVLMTRGHVSQRMIQGNYSQVLTRGPLLCTLPAWPQGYCPVTRNSSHPNRRASGNSTTLRRGLVQTRWGAKKISLLPLPCILLPQSLFPRRVSSQGSWLADQEPLPSGDRHPHLHGTSKKCS